MVYASWPRAVAASVGVLALLTPLTLGHQVHKLLGPRVHKQDLHWAVRSQAQTSPHNTYMYIHIRGVDREMYMYVYM